MKKLIVIIFLLPTTLVARNAVITFIDIDGEKKEYSFFESERDMNVVKTKLQNVFCNGRFSTTTTNKESYSFSCGISFKDKKETFIFLASATVVCDGKHSASLNFKSSPLSMKNSKNMDAFIRCTP